MLHDRNLTVHTYIEDLAISVTDNISKYYLNALKELLSALKSS